VNLIGFVPFFYGLYIIYKYVFRQKNRNIYFVLSFIFASGLLLWLRLIPFTTGLMFLGVFLILLLSVYMKILFEYIEKTRFQRWKALFFLSLTIAFITTSLIPTFAYSRLVLNQGYSLEETQAFGWMSSLPPGSKVLASPSEGHLITFFSGRMNVIDSNYLYIRDIDSLFQDARDIYTSRYETQILDLVAKHGITHILVSPRVKEYYGEGAAFAFSASACFIPVYQEGSMTVYESACILEEV